MKKLIVSLLAVMMIAAVSGCAFGSRDKVISADESGYAEGGYNDIMHTAFFEYQVKSAYLCDEFEGYTPTDGKALLVADVTVKNPYNGEVTMYDTDFQVQWDSDEDDAYGWPVTYYVEENTFSDKVLPVEYDIKKFGSRDGLLIFEVPKGETYFSISYLEIYEDNTEGNVFFVYFNADYK